jgi:undecaprenyl-diphosphatase
MAALGLLVALVGFLKIAEELMEGELTAFDEWLLQLLRLPDNLNVPIGPPWLLGAAKDITVLGGRTLLIAVVLLAIGYLALERKHHAMWLVAVAAAGGGFLSATMKDLYARSRPNIVPHLVVVDSPSFPSGHAMLAAIIYLTLGVLLARLAARRRTRVYLLTVAVMLTLLVGASRVYLGVHHPTDVFAGWCAGVVWALICWLVTRYLQARGAVEKPRQTRA